ncbi:MAG TPA: 3-deoxy-manno-octulosonate cytidylyltransferase [Thermoanaerobaculia bacterium]|nr:3-deoxy-manno-octulosonate cytidylyltransferase [Thermoanaerobaculia bacterium]
MNAVIVIPARWASTRFPGKPLAMIAGTSLIRRVYERANLARRASAIFVATDDDRIADHVAKFGGKVVQPKGDFQSGTDRIAASLDLLGGEFDQVIHLQGDEPLIDAASIDALIENLQRTKADMVTLACPFENDGERESRDIVKVVTTLDGTALYFSRAPLAGSRHHIGLYGYQTGVLRALAKLEPSPLERAESLEQLRALQNGFRIQVLHTRRPHLGIDRPEDVLRVEQELAKHG